MIATKFCAEKLSAKLKVCGRVCEYVSVCVFVLNQCAAKVFARARTQGKSTALQSMLRFCSLFSRTELRKSEYDCQSTQDLLYHMNT